MKLAIQLPNDKITEFCHRWQIQEFALFGSILRSDFSPNSDIDVLATFETNACWSLLDRVRMEQELTKILGRDVDLIDRDEILESPNWIRRREILNNAKTLLKQKLNL